MTVRVPRGVVRSTSDYICLSCRFQRLLISSHHRRYQHVAATQSPSNVLEHPVSTKKSNSKAQNGLSSTAPFWGNHIQVAGNSTFTEAKTGDEAKPIVELQTTPSPEATKLQNDLQRQFAERRRQNTSKKGLRTSLDASESPSEPSTNHTPDAGHDADTANRLPMSRKARMRTAILEKKLQSASAKDKSKIEKKIADLVRTIDKGGRRKSDAKTNESSTGDSAMDISKADPKIHPVRRKGKAASTKEQATVRKYDSEAPSTKEQATVRKYDLEAPALTALTASHMKSARIKAAQSHFAAGMYTTELAGPPGLPKVWKHMSSPPESAEAPDQPNVHKYYALPKETTVTLRESRESPEDTKGSRIAVNTKKPLSKSTKKPSDELSKTIKVPSLNLSPQTQSRKNAPIEAVNASDLQLTALEIAQPPIRNLSYGLERVLFNPGVYHLQDPRSRVFNFDPYLQKIMPVAEFDFDALKAYITSSGDEALKNIARTYGKRYTGSSSSMTSILTHFHFLLSQWREIQTDMLSNEFPTKSSLKTFTLIQRAPTAVFLRWKNGSYAIDADKSFSSANILMMLGKSMEKLLTLSKDEFERYRKSNPDEVPAEARNAPESYHYTTLGDFLMRSQLDAHDSRLPGTGMFDLKTRAVVAVRMDAKQYERGMDYEIKTRQGAWESYEREYFDMIRAAFLKYSLQVRMGRMDGIFVAFHNTQRIFGFQYISSSEMDAALHGQWDTTLGDQEFKASVELLNKVLDKATEKYPEQSLRIHFETRDAQTNFMYVFAEPVTEEQVDEMQSRNNAEVEEFERKILGMDKDDSDGGTEGDDGKWADMQANVEEEMEYDSSTVPSMEEAHSEMAESDATLERGPDATSDTQGSASESGPDTTAKDTSAANDVLEMFNSEDDEARLDQKDGVRTLDGDNGDLVVEDLDQYEDLEEGLSETEAEADRQSENDVLEPSSRDNGNEVSPDLPGDIVEDTTSDALEEIQFLAEDNEAADEDIVAEDSDPDASEIEISSSSSGELRISSLLDASESETSTPPSDPDTSPDTAFLSSLASSNPEPPSSTQEVLALTLTIRNKVNDRYVVRPEKLSSTDRWVVEYALADVSKPEKAWSLYQASMARRKRQLDRADDDDDKTVDWYIKNLRDLSKKGKEWREKQDELDKAKPKVTLGQDLPKEEKLS